MAAIHRQTSLNFDPPPALAAVASLLRAVRLTGRPPASIEAKPAAPAGLELTTARLHIRPLRASDRAEFQRVLLESKDHLARFCPLTKGDQHGSGERGAFSRHLDLCLAGDRTGKAWRRMLFDHAGRLVGAININDITRGLENTGEMVAWLSEDAVGKGLAKEAIHAVLAWAFADAPDGLGLHKIIGLISPDNAPSIALVERLGFERGVGEPPVELIINERPVMHDLWVMYAPVPPTIEPLPPVAEPDRPLVRGLWSMLKLEARAALVAHEGV
jgi:[ribosomal protein S5]-alanine N-acetyltransferase